MEGVVPVLPPPPEGVEVPQPAEADVFVYLDLKAQSPLDEQYVLIFICAPEGHLEVASILNEMQSVSVKEASWLPLPPSMTVTSTMDVVLSPCAQNDAPFIISSF